MKLGLIAAAVTVTTGCASIINGTQQSVKVETLTEKGESVAGADCRLSNANGTVAVDSGQTALVNRSGSTLRMKCLMDGHAPAAGDALSRVNGGLIGNVLFGGLIGIIIDLSNGAGFSYPDEVRLVFGQERAFDRYAGAAGGGAAGQLIGPVADEPRKPAGAGRAKPQGAAEGDASSNPLNRPLGKGDVLQYVLTDKSTGRESKVDYRLDEIKGKELIFNQGERIETADGRVVQVRSMSAGLFDSLMPEGGWLPLNIRPGMSWSAESASVKVRAAAGDESTVMIDGESVRVIAVKVTGWQLNANAQPTSGLLRRSSQVIVTLLYAPEMKRVVQADAEVRGDSGRAHESFKLQRVARSSQG
ncbi:MAG: hypothetical protein KKC85_18100 [Gammaproteobacteria bacterium]|nr:hypothetical protein [Gammaproteobacteria bacterium]MBU1441570.1 hypothetical protein [Gammaproteobacteria bacterium]MBU2288323.1 hypothetical protein [Gammaproteobacteria bacterium]